METVIRQRGRSALYVLSASLLSFTSHSAIAAGVLPTGGNFAAGSGKISGTANTLTVNQTTKNGIINWTGFSIGQGNTVRINNGSGATLNRVTGTSPSSIAGWLTSSGSTYLINQNGIVVTPSGKVVTGGKFVGSTRDTSNSGFMAGAGNLEFTGTSSGTVTNQGSISASGDVVLIGKSATNSGNISAPNGTVGVVAGDDVVLQPSGSGLQIEVKTGSGEATTSGNITAAQALIDAAGGNAYALAGNNGGIVRATGTKNINGHVWLTAPNGTAQVTGTIDAQNKNGSGGAIDVQGQNINVSGTLNASDAAPKGNGGDITVGSATTPSTTVTGILDARGGAKGGNGGNIETSGEALNTSGSKVDTTAPKGQTGNWTLDPFNLTISTGTTSNETASGSPTSGYTASSTNSVLNVNDLETALASSNVTVATGSRFIATSDVGDITVAAPVTWSVNTLTLDAFHSININAPVSATGTAGLTLKTNDHGSGGGIYYNVGSTTFYNVGNITFANTSEALIINGAAYTLISNMGQLQAINSNLNGNYALANSINAASDPTMPASWASIGTDGAGTIFNSHFGFAGVFDGLGNTISGLSVQHPGSYYTGLFGWSDGTIQNVGIAGASINGNFYTGPLAGVNNGTISNSWATGTVKAFSSSGGLVGWNTGAISNSFAVANVTATGTGGGLVGIQTAGSITNAYATGAVNAETAGGLIGDMTAGTVTNVYSIGPVNTCCLAGGLIANKSGGTLTNAYWDTQSSGQPNSSGGGTGLTTAQLSAALPAGFDPTIWGNANNQTTPYLLANPGPVFAGSDSTHLFTLVFNMGQLQAINASSASLQGNYALANSLDASTDPTTPASWIPIGTDGAGHVSSSGFTGIFDGLSNTISNLSINVPANYVGLFGYSTGTIRNIGLPGASVTGGSYVGPLVGDAGGTISNSYATGTVSGDSYAGGLVGYSGATISNSHASATVTLPSSGSYGGTGWAAGGLVGENDGTISNDFATGTTSGYESIGGLAGVNNGTISFSYATGNVPLGSGAYGAAGGLVGFNNGGTISNSYATGSVNMYDGNSVFGVRGGGLVGLNGQQVGAGGGISDSYANGSVNAYQFSGGLVGTNLVSISNSYATGSVSGVSQVGGLTGWNYNPSGTTNSAALTPAQLSAALPNGFSSSVWGNGNNQTTPYLLANPGPVYIGSDRSQQYTPIITMGQLQAINNNLGGFYLLGNSLNAATDPTTPASWTPIGTNGAGGILNSGSGFTGTFDGLGNTVSNLTVNRSSANYVGLFGYSNGTLRNIGVVGVNARGNQYIGGLAGDSRGTITNSYSTGTVNGVYNGGGLVGENDGAISDAYSTAAVTTTGFRAGGLAGTNAGSITNAYATGSVTSQEIAGGLIGLTQGGSITNVYSTGAVNSGGFAEGLIGYNNGGTLTNGYWDTQSSGQSFSQGGVGLTTAQLQGTLPAGFSTSDWGVAAGYYPWLLFSPPFIYTTATLTGTVIKTYDGTIFATLAASNYSLSNGAQAGWLTVNGQPVTGPTTGKFSTQNVGKGLMVTVTGLGLNLPAGDSYMLTSATVSGNIGEIDPATLTITAAADTKVYDGATASAQTPTFKVAGEPANTLFGSDTLTGLTQAFASKNVLGTNGSTLKVTGYSVNDGNSGNNYSVSLATAPGTITPAALSITATTDTKVYDGTRSSSATPTFQVSNQPVNTLYGSDTLTGLTQTFASKDVLGSGNSLLGTAPGYTLNDGNGGADYTLSFHTAPGTITPAALSITAATDTKTYDGTRNSLAAPTFQVTNEPANTLYGSDTLTGLTQTFASKDVLGSGNSLLGTAPGYTLSDGNGGADYTLSFHTAPGTITPAALSVTATADTKAYDGTRNSSATPTFQVANEPENTLYGSDTLTGLTQTFASKDVLGSGNSLLGTAPGYTLSDGNGGADYTLSFHTVPGTITPASLTISAVTDNKVYNGTIASSQTPTVSGLITIGGDTVNGLSQAFAAKDVLGTGGSTIKVTAYTVNDGNGGKDYAVTLAPASGTITPALLTVTAASQTKAYDGTTSSTSVDPYSGAMLSTVAPGITSGQIYGSDTIALSEAFVGPNAGASTLKPTVAINDGVGGADYAVTLVNASGTINRRPIALTGSRTYDGTTNASAGILTMTNVVSGDSLTLSGTGVLTGNGLTNANQTPAFASIGTLALGGASVANYTLANITTPVVVGSQTLNTVYISFSGVTLTSGTSLTGANLSGLNLTGVSLSGQNLTGTNLTGTNLTGANLSGTNLKTATLTNANLSGATLTGANLMGDSLSGANLTSASLAGSNLMGDNLAGANLTGANLAGANLSHEDLLNAILINANLMGANLSFANLTDANLTGANTTGTNLHGANLTGVIQ